MYPFRALLRQLEKCFYLKRKECESLQLFTQVVNENKGFSALQVKYKIEDGRKIKKLLYLYF